MTTVFGRRMAFRRGAAVLAALAVPMVVPRIVEASTGRALSPSFERMLEAYRVADPQQIQGSEAIFDYMTMIFEATPRVG